LSTYRKSIAFQKKGVLACMLGQLKEYTYTDRILVRKYNRYLELLPLLVTKSATKVMAV
jgi:hypothetical protein